MVEIGKKYGHLLVISGPFEDDRGRKRWTCMCDCGAESEYVERGLKSKTKWCMKCRPHSGGIPKQDIVGRSIGSWTVLSEKCRENGVYKYYCRCNTCGAVSIRTLGVIKSNKSGKCKNCPPDYRFRIDGEAAYGTLPDGTEFIISASDVERVKKEFWRITKENYIIGKDSVRFHRWLLGVTDPTVIIDHINRNPLDNRRSNLRVSTALGNAQNHNKSATNNSGYLGVYYSKCSGRYEVKINIGTKRLLLGSSKNDIVQLAQMYNIAALFLRGENVGEMNDVPEPSEELKSRVIRKCAQYVYLPNKKGA